MTNLSELVKKYKETNDKKILNDIFYQLRNILKKKAQHVFYQKEFKIQKSSYKLIDTKLIDFEDVLSELNLLILKLINNYNIEQDFETYLFASIWNWRPDCIHNIKSNKNPAKFVGKVITMNEDENEIDILDENSEYKVTNELNADELFENLTETEKKIINLLQDDHSLTQQQLSQIIGVTQQRISQLLIDIKKKYIR